MGDDGISRPVILGQVLAADNSWVRALFLLDTGADRTVLSASVLRLLDLPKRRRPDRIAGLGGLVPSVSIDTEIRLVRDSGTEVLFRGEFGAVPELEALDMCVLGRDITAMFTVFVDQPANAVYLLR